MESMGLPAAFGSTSSKFVEPSSSTSPNKSNQTQGGSRGGGRPRGRGGARGVSNDARMGTRPYRGGRGGGGRGGRGRGTGDQGYRGGRFGGEGRPVNTGQGTAYYDEKFFEDPWASLSSKASSIQT